MSAADLPSVPQPWTPVGVGLGPDGFDVTAVAGGWVVADRLPESGSLHHDHVIGPGGASATLAGLTPRRPVASALDLGCGCGVQAIGLASHARSVMATDVNPRAVELTGLSAALSGVTIDARTGSWFEPVAGERFDLIVSNPPFVIADPDAGVYRSAGLTGDDATWIAATGAAQHLAVGGIAVLLGSWLLRPDEDWRDRVMQQLGPTGCDLRVVQRQQLSVAEYVDVWLADGARLDAAEREATAQRWHSALRATGAVGVGSGWLMLRRTERSTAVRRLVEDPRPVDFPLGEEVADWFDRVDWLERTDEAGLAAAILRPSADLSIGGGRIRRLGGLLDAPIDPFGEAVIAGCDGRPIGVVVAATAERFDLDLPSVAVAADGVLRALIEAGALLPPAPP